MLQNALDLTVSPLEDSETSASEENTVPVWAESALTALSDQGMNLDGNAVLTRGEAAQLLYRTVHMKQYPVFSA